MKKTGQSFASVGVAEHSQSATFVTVGPDGELLDRRTVALTQGLPSHPYHHEGSWAIGRYVDSPWARAISLPDAIALVDRVREAAAAGARESLESLAGTLSVPIATISLRVCPELPPTTEERIRDTRAANVADSVMYREAIAAAARARGWTVHWYDRDRVFDHANIETELRDLGRVAGPPWQAKHKLATAAALAGNVRRRSNGVHGRSLKDPREGDG